MIKPGALVMGAVMAAVSAGTYFGLGLLPPGTIPPPIGRVPPPPPHTVGEHTLVASVDAKPSAAPAAPAPAPATAAAPTEQELAEEPAPQAAPATPAKAKEVVQAAAAPQAKPEPAPAPKAEPKAEPNVEPAPEPAPAPVEKPKAAAKHAPKPAEPVAPETAASSEPVTPSTTTADSDAMKQWWPEPGKLPANQLKLVYAGDVQGEAAIALLFGSVPNMDSLRTHAHVRNVVGADMPGTWEAGKNPQLVVFRGLASGRYTVILDKELADMKGFALGQTLQGPVYIRAK